MAAGLSKTEYVVWGSDQTAYGPVEFPTLVSWVKDERVTADTWIFVGETGEWQRAATVPALQELLTTKTGAPAPGAARMPPAGGLVPAVLRRVHILAGLTDEQLARLALFVEVERIPAGTVVVHQGERDNTLYMIL